VVAFTRQAIKGLLQDEVLQTSQVYISGSCGVRSRLVRSESRRRRVEDHGFEAESVGVEGEPRKQCRIIRCLRRIESGGASFTSNAEKQGCREGNNTPSQRLSAQPRTSVSMHDGVWDLLNFPKDIREGSEV